MASPGRADEADRLAGGSWAPGVTAGSRIGEVAVRPGLPVGGLHREAGAAARVPAPGVEDGPVGERVERRALGRGDVGGGVVVVGVRDGDDRRAAADREDVVAGGLHRRRGEELAGRLVERRALRLVLAARRAPPGRRRAAASQAIRLRLRGVATGARTARPTSAPPAGRREAAPNPRASVAACSRSASARARSSATRYAPLALVTAARACPARPGAVEREHGALPSANVLEASAGPPSPSCRRAARAGSPGSRTSRRGCRRRRPGGCRSRRPTRRGSGRRSRPRRPGSTGRRPRRRRRPFPSEPRSTA